MPNPFLQDGRPATSQTRQAERLDSWKEIANFFRREVRTVQLWEKHEGLPVRRQHHKKLGSIYAYRAELESWRLSRSKLDDSPQSGTEQPDRAQSAGPIGPERHTHHPPPIPRLNEPRSSADTCLAAHACTIGFHFWNIRSRHTIPRALRYFKDAIELDPHCADAYAGMANVYVSLSYNHLISSREAAVRAHRAVQRAMELDAASATVRNAAVNVLTNCTWDWKAAEQQCRQMFDSGSMNTRTIQLYASLLSAQGRHPESIALALEAHRLEPDSAIANNLVSLSYFYASDYERALPYSRRALTQMPDYTMGYALLGRVQAQRGEWDQALSAFRQVESKSGDAPFARALVAYACAGGGDIEQAHTMVAALAQMERDPRYPAYDISGVYAVLHQEAEALQNVSRACETRDVKAIFMNDDPRFANVRHSASFRRIASSHLGWTH